MLIPKKPRVKPARKANWEDVEILFKSMCGPGYYWCTAWQMTSEELKLDMRVKDEKKGV